MTIAAQLLPITGFRASGEQQVPLACATNAYLKLPHKQGGHATVTMRQPSKVSFGTYMRRIQEVAFPGNRCSTRLHTSWIFVTTRELAMIDLPGIRSLPPKGK